MYWSLPSPRSRLSRSSRYFSRSAAGSNARSGIRGLYCRGFQLLLGDRQHGGEQAAARGEALDRPGRVGREEVECLLELGGATFVDGDVEDLDVAVVALPA